MLFIVKTANNEIIIYIYIYKTLRIRLIGIKGINPTIKNNCKKL